MSKISEALKNKTGESAEMSIHEAATAVFEVAQNTDTNGGKAAALFILSLHGYRVFDMPRLLSLDAYYRKAALQLINYIAWDYQKDISALINEAGCDFSDWYSTLDIEGLKAGY